MTMNRLVSSRMTQLAALAALATLSLTACGSDPNSATAQRWSRTRQQRQRVRPRLPSGQALR